MKKWMAMLMLGASMLVFASGCGNEDLKTSAKVDTNITEGSETPQVTPEASEEPQEVSKEEPPIQIDETKEIINKVEDANYLQGLNLCSSYTLALQDENIAIELYVSAEIDANGEIMLDDGQEWSLVARVEDAIYPLVERTYIQNGQVHYSVYTDYDHNEMPHIVAQITSSAGMNYYDFTYDEKVFSRETVLEANNINLLYTY
nr:hypothetical protein [uncultured Cellulosilyticum sp.]